MERGQRKTERSLDGRFHDEILCGLARREEFNTYVADAAPPGSEPKQSGSGPSRVDRRRETTLRATHLVQVRVLGAGDVAELGQDALGLELR
jgi:hypothetical protein